MAKFAFNTKEKTSTAAPVVHEGASEDHTPAILRKADTKIGGISGDFSEKDIKLPRLNIVQGVGAMSEDFKPGSIIWNGEVTLIKPKDDVKEWTDPLEVTVLTARKDFIQNTEYDSDDRADIVDSLEEVERRGGTIEYNGDQAPSWLPRLTMLLLIKAPKGNIPAEDSFSLVDPEGAPCEMALWTVKKSAYTRAGKAVITASKYSLRNKATNEPELHHGKWTLQVRREKLGEYLVYVPLLKQCGRHTAEYAEFAAGLI